MPLHDYTPYDFTAQGEKRTIYRRGSGPGVIILHELGGLNPETVAFADRIVARGFSVHLPLLFGEPGQLMTNGRNLGYIARFCISREWNALACGKTRPVADWVRELGRKVHSLCGGKGIGAIGMCLTGSFVIPLVLEKDFLVAPVTCEPSIPFGFTKAQRGDPGVADADLEGARRQLTENDLVLLGFRFSHDTLSPCAKFVTLRERLGNRFEGHEIDSGSGNPHGYKASAHSVFTFDYRDNPDDPTRMALERVVAYFQQKLLNRPLG